jgi:hypothetical protein
MSYGQDGRNYQTVPAAAMEGNRETEEREKWREGYRK